MGTATTLMVLWFHNLVLTPGIPALQSLNIQQAVFNARASVIVTKGGLMMLAYSGTLI